MAYLKSSIFVVLKTFFSLNQDSQAWMEWVMKKQKAFDQRGDMTVAAWVEQQQREMTLPARRLLRSKVSLCITLFHFSLINDRDPDTSFQNQNSITLCGPTSLLISYPHDMYFSLNPTFKILDLG